MVSSIRKGKQFEREIAHLLTKLCGKQFKRVPCSGALSTTQRFESNVFKGDVTCESEPFNKLVVECKIIGKALKLADFMREKAILWEWWDQTIKEAGQNKFILVFRYKHGPIMSLSRESLLSLSIPAESSLRLVDLNGDICYLSILK